MPNALDFNPTINNILPPPFQSSNNSNETNFGPDNNNNGLPYMNSSDKSSEVIFYLLITLIIPSIICSLFLFYNFIHLPQLRAKSSNLLIICLLINNFIHILVDLPFRLFFLSQNQILIQNPIFCLLWTWYDNILTTIDLFIMAFISIERYLSIFHHIFLRRHKPLLYLVSTITCFAVPIIWYTVLIFGYPCRNLFMYLSFQCGPLCYLTNSPVFINFENFVFFMFPLSIIVVGNSTLMVRVLLQKASMRRKRCLLVWRNNLRMISQLMFIAVLYMSIYIPSCILLIFGSYVQRSPFQQWAVSVRTLYFIHLKYLVIFGCPFMVLAGQKEMREKLKKIFCCTPQTQRAIRPVQIHPMAMIQT